MASINIYLSFPGNAEEAFNFYKSVFGGEFSNLQRFGGSSSGDKLSAEDREKIMHVALPIGDGYMLMASDSLESMGHSLTVGNNCYISIQADNKEEAIQLFNGLSDGGNIEMPLQDTFWNAHFGMFTDKFGVHWMVNYAYDQ